MEWNENNLKGDEMNTDSYIDEAIKLFEEGKKSKEVQIELQQRFGLNKSKSHDIVKFTRIRLGSYQGTKK